MPGQTGTGHQYEVLLKEKAETLNQIEELKRVNGEQRKATNQLKAQEGKLKFELTEKAEDLDEALQKLAQKETRLQGVKDTLRRQDEQIDELRRELNAAQDKERQQITLNDSLKKKNQEL